MSKKISVKAFPTIDALSAYIKELAESDQIKPPTPEEAADDTCDCDVCATRAARKLIGDLKEKTEMQEESFKAMDEVMDLILRELLPKEPGAEAPDETYPEAPSAEAAEEPYLGAQDAVQGIAQGVAWGVPSSFLITTVNLQGVEFSIRAQVPAMHDVERPNVIIIPGIGAEPLVFSLSQLNILLAALTAAQGVLTIED